MRNINNQINRITKTRSYKKIFYIATEGKVTEKEYFDIFRAKNSNIKIVFCSKDNKSNPISLLRKINVFLKSNNIMSTDEAWLVIDKDSWTDNDISTVYKWAKSSSNYGVALSTPNFEYWLLLHFENGSGVNSSESCLTHLSRYINNYNKHLDKKLFSSDNIKTAIQNSISRLPKASKSSIPQCTACSTVHLLVENILYSL